MKWVLMIMHFGSGDVPAGAAALTYSTEAKCKERIAAHTRHLPDGSWSIAACVQKPAPVADL